MNTSRPYVMSIAGFDPSGGAGILADIKTFEACGAYGLGVCSAITYQNDITFERVEWLDVSRILDQIRILLKRFHPKVVKIGLIESLDVVSELTGWLKKELPETKVIWDPIMKASAGFTFHDFQDLESLKRLLKKLFLVTPNIPEAERMGPSDEATENALFMKEYCNVYLKGGHSGEDQVTDVLYCGVERKEYASPKIEGGEKHGSGCVLSASLAAFLSQGEDLDQACVHTKHYIRNFLSSNSTLLGYHIFNQDTLTYANQ